MVFELGSHAEIYADCSEFVERKADQGLILVAHEEAPILLETLKDGGFELPVVIYAAQPETGDVVEAIQAGALDFVEWPAGREQLSRTLARARETGSEMMALMRKQSAARKLVNSLTRREMDVLLGITKGGSNKSIAAELGISPRTVEIHRSNMMRRLKVGATGDAVRIAIYAGLDSEIDLAA
jgi:FixJ family two-component response regulator